LSKYNVSKRHSEHFSSSVDRILINYMYASTGVPFVYRGSVGYWPIFLIINGEIEYISIIMNNWCFFPYSINYFLFQSLTIVEIIIFLINWNCWCVVASLNVFKSDVICILLHPWCVALLIREDYKPENDIYFSKNGGLDYHWIKNNVLSLIWIGKK
jgi:hypothetical protein